MMIIGASAPKAIRPKPSSSGLRPRMLVARPTPRAVSSGAVTVDATTPPGIEGEPDQLRRGERCQDDDDQVTGNQIVANGMAEDDAPDPDHHRHADAKRGDHAQGQRRHAAARNRLGLVGDGHQRRLGGDRGEADAEGEQHQPEKRPAAGEVEGHRFAGRKDRRVEPLDEQREAEEDDGEAADQRRRAVGHALDEEHLEDDDDDERRRQVAHRLVQQFANDAKQ